MSSRPARAITTSELPAPARSIPEPQSPLTIDRAITPRAIAEPELRPIPWSALFGIELRNALTLQLSRVSLLLGTALGVVGLVIIVLLHTLTDFDPATLSNPEVIRAAATGSAQLLLPLSAIALLTTEWRDRSIASRFLAVPSRIRILVAKIVTSIMITMAIMVLLTLCYLAAGRIVAGPDMINALAAQVPQTILPTIGATIWACAIAAVTRRTAASLVIYLLIVFLAPSIYLVAQVIGAAQGWPWLPQLAGIFDINQTVTSWAALQPTQPIWTGLLSVLVMVILPLALAVRQWRRADL